MNNDVIYREACLEDREGILGIGKMYNGMDYMKKRIDKILTDKDILCYVAEIGGQIVGFNSMVFGQDYAVKCSLRVHVNHRKRGIGTVLSEHLISASKEMRKDAMAKILIVSLDNSFYRDQMSDELGAFAKYTCLHKMKYTSLCTTASSVRNFARDTPFPSEVKQPTADEFFSFMRQHTSLFGDDFIVYWDPRTFDSLQELYDNLEIFIYKSSIAFYKIFHIETATRVDIDMFGVSASDMRVFVTAVLHRLNEGIFENKVEVLLFNRLDVHLSDDDVLQEKLNWTPGLVSSMTNRHERWLLRLNE
ncbi:hypothetical protein CAPTEDRAFT_209112 [Capitella teleta]|uniref:N-acetyltransferase domain-containing protein n=1 Tax=Capitella teleta TaxID=283909 RepID=R7US48_CAPTE|nr:hypothetical protein CAPTEDRAFT_209112 [Capitella teleta]|eukprot:ELU06737.1 hypothetical protein CAPTEDRAFT_209112 [Capitella teleta]